MNMPEKISQWKREGLTIVFTNGVFDIIHVGHVRYLEKSRSLGHRLVVGLNSDRSARRLNKGPERPINPQQAREEVLNALRCVDAVIVFDEDTPLSLIEAIKPDVLVKGGDYDAAEKNPSSKKYIVGSDVVRATGGRVEVIPLVEGYSTTAIASILVKP